MKHGRVYEKHYTLWDNMPGVHSHIKRTGASSGVKKTVLVPLRRPFPVPFRVMGYPKNVNG